MLPTLHRVSLRRFMELVKNTSPTSAPAKYGHTLSKLKSIHIRAEAPALCPDNVLAAVLIDGDVLACHLSAVIDLHRPNRRLLMCKQEDAGEKGCRQDRVAGYFSHRISAIMMSIE